MEIKSLLLGVIIIIILKLIIDKLYTEKFGGAMTQLMAKGPQDLHLTINTEKYVPELWYPDYLPLTYWNYPTRRTNYYYPYYAMYDYVFPFWY